MSDSSNNHEAAHSADLHGASDNSSNKGLPHVESPGIAPGSPNTVKDDADHHAKPSGAAPAYPQGTMVILAPQPTGSEAPKAALASVSSSSRFRLSTHTAMVAVAAAIGGLAGSLATAGISHLTTPESRAPSYYSALAEALGRVDHELTALKSAAESSAKATDQQVAKIAERVDRAEKTQPDTGVKLAKAPDSIGRMERRFAAASGDITGTVAESRVAMAAARPMAIESKQPSLTPIVDGWVVRDVYNGSAWIQGRAGIVQVIPGDNLPGLGRIEQVRRQDGRWVVVTSRGQIVSR